MARPARVTDHILHHGGKSIHPMAAQVKIGSARSIELLEDEVAHTRMRHDSTLAGNPGATVGQTAPIQLGRPLPFLPTYAPDPMHRDTVFSLIDGYTTNRSDTASSLGLHEPGWDNVSSDDIFSAKPPPQADCDAFHPAAILQPRDSGCSMYSNAALKQTSDSNDHGDSSSTWDPEEGNECGSASGSGADRSESDLANDGFEPPPNLASIEAIARRPSPGRYPNGVPLNFGKSLQ